MRRFALLGGVPERFHLAEFSGALDYAFRTFREIWREQLRLSPRERLARVAHAGKWLARFLVKSRGSKRDASFNLGAHPTVVMTGAVPDANEAGYQTADRAMAAHARYMEDAWNSYVPRKYPGRVAIIWPMDGPANPPWDPRAMWTRLTPAHDWQVVPGTHWTILSDDLEHSGRALGASIENARQS